MMGTLIAALLPIAIPLVKRLIHGAEETFGPRTGETKAKVVVQGLAAFAEALATAGKIPSMPSAELLATMVEMVFQNDKGAGTPTIITSVSAPPCVQVVVGKSVLVEAVAA